MRVDSYVLKDMKILKYYRLVRKWACKTYSLNDADLELLIYLDSLGRFTRKDFMNGVYLYSWDKHRWERLRKEGWIEAWRERNRLDSKYAIYKTSFKFSLILARIYRILSGEEDLPVTNNNVFYKNKTYTERVFNKAMDDMLKDKDR